MQIYLNITFLLVDIWEVYVMKDWFTRDELQFLAIAYWQQRSYKTLQQVKTRAILYRCDTLALPAGCTVWHDMNILLSSQSMNIK
jgi:hypothetical protein